MALQTEHVHQAHIEQPGIGGSVRRVATGAALCLHRHVLVDERSLLIDVALVANGVSARQGSHLPHCRRPVRVVAVVALHQALVDPVVIRFGEIRLGRSVASVTQLRLLLDQQVTAFLGVMGRVAVQTANIAAGVGGLRKMRLLVASPWQVRQRALVSCRDCPSNTNILVLSPPPATWSAPGPWQPSQPCFEGPPSLFSVVFQCGVFSQAL